MHDNANITCAITEIDETFGIILALQPRVSGGTGISREDYIVEMCKDMAKQLQQEYDVEVSGREGVDGVYIFVIVLVDLSSRD